MDGCMHVSLRLRDGLRLVVQSCERGTLEHRIGQTVCLSLSLSLKMAVA